MRIRFRPDGRRSIEIKCIPQDDGRDHDDPAENEGALASVASVPSAKSKSTANNTLLTTWPLTKGLTQIRRLTQLPQRCVRAKTAKAFHLQASLTQLTILTQESLTLLRLRLVRTMAQGVRSAALRALQFRPRASDLAHDSRDGCWRDRSAMVGRGIDRDGDR